MGVSKHVVFDHINDYIYGNMASVLLQVYMINFHWCHVCICMRVIKRVACGGSSINMNHAFEENQVSGSY